MTLFETTVQSIRPVDPVWIERARSRQLQLTKPPGSLGRLEELANRCVAIRETIEITAERPRIVLFAGDHGVCAEGVSAYPPEVTAQMVANFLAGGAGINALAGSGGIALDVVDVGVAAPIAASESLIARRVAAGTRNFCKEPAMTEAEMMQAIQTGIEMANHAADLGADLLGFGEMGIGNTTAASAITAALTDLPAERVAGYGTMIDRAGFERKCSAISRALQLHAGHLGSPLGILRCVGGLEIAAMCGFTLGAAARRIPVFTDGFIATSAAALAARICPASRDCLFASHQSAEPGHAHLLAMIGLEPLLSLGLRLGEATGAALAMQVARSSIAAFTQMATFASAGVSDR